MSVPAHERPELALDQNNNLFLRTFELPKGFEQGGCIGEDPNKDADHRNKGEERPQQSNKPHTSVAFIEVIQGKRPAKSQEGELDECPICLDAPSSADARVLRCCTAIM